MRSFMFLIRYYKRMALAAVPETALRTLVQPLDNLLRAERNQDDDTNFTGALARAVQRLWQMEVHATGPGERGLTNVTVRAMRSAGAICG